MSLIQGLLGCDATVYCGGIS